MNQGVSQSVRANARREAANDDEFAICCSDGDIAYAGTKAGAMDILNEMRSMRKSLNPTGTYDFEVEVLNADYRYAGLWTCDGCGEEFLVTTKFGPAAHALGCGQEAGGTDDRSTSQE